MLNRRHVLRAAALGAGYGLIPRAFAKADTDARFVLVILRGAADGLAIAAPYGDGNYETARGELALPGGVFGDGDAGDLVEIHSGATLSANGGWRTDPACPRHGRRSRSMSADRDRS